MRGIPQLLVPWAVATSLAVVVAGCRGGAEGGNASPSTAAAPSATATPASTPAASPLAQGVKYGGTLHAREQGYFSLWDTYDSQNAYSIVFIQNALSHLVHVGITEPGSIVPDTAQGWEVREGGRVFVFTLRKDVLWHDGKRFTSADVLYNLRRAWKPPEPVKSWNTPRMALVESIEAPDQSTVRITLKRPSASFLTGIGVPFMLMYPAHIPDMAQWQQTAIGSGPFRFVRTTPSGTEWARNGRYYKRDEEGRRLPYLDGITFYTIASTEIALSAFLSGRLDCGCGYDNDYQQPAVGLLQKKIPGLKVTENFAAGDGFLFNQRPPWTDPRVRKAVALGLDKAALAAAYHEGGHFTPASPLLPPELGGSWGLTRSEILQVPGYREPHSLDVAEAQELLRAADVDPKSLAINLIFPLHYAEAAEAAVPFFRAVGGKASVRILGDDYTDALMRGDYDIAIQFAAIATDDPSDAWARFTRTGASANYARWSNSKLDALFEEQDRTFDPAKRKELLRSYQMELLDWGVLVPWIWERTVYAVWPQVNGFTHGAMAVSAGFRLERVWLEK